MFLVFNNKIFILVLEIKYGAMGDLEGIVIRRKGEKGNYIEEVVFTILRGLKIL